MHIGLCLPQLGGHVNRHGLRAFCEQAEKLGYGSLWVQEHIFYPLHPVSGYSARVDELCEEVARSRAAGVGAVIVDTNFDPALDTPQRWAEVPRTLAPLLDAAA